MLYPISFSVPEEIIVPYVPFKTLHTAQHSYQFTSAEPYLKNYRSAIFGNTCMKCGWDAFRHYEILSQGTIPNFENLENCPSKTLHCFPKTQVLGLIEKYGHQSFHNIMKESSSILYNDLEELLTYTRNHMTTRKEADYILSKTETPSTRKVLFLHNTDNVDYLCFMTAHGLTRLTEGEVDIYPSLHYMYENYPQEATKQLYGRGFNYTRHLPQHFQKSTTLEDIWQKIKAREYEQIIYFVNCKSGLLIPFMGSEKNINAYYSPHEISILCGRDCDPYRDATRDPNREWWIRDYHTCSLAEYSSSYNVFVRELGN